MEKESDMPRIDPPGPDDVGPEERQVMERFYQARGNVPNMFRTMALRPELMRSAEAHMAAVLKTGTVPLEIKELVVCRVSQLNSCTYCLTSHSAILRGLGVSQETIDQLADPAAHALHPPAVQAALAFAEQLTRDSLRVDDALWERLRAHFDEGQIVEIAAVAGLFNYFNRFNNALQMELTQPGWPAREARGEQSS
jgi:uncharacterized peroxidase-related enzyme